MSDSSPMADSTVPTLTKTTSSPASARAPSIESDVLTPPPEEPKALVVSKRKAPASQGKENGAKKQKTTPAESDEQSKEKKPYCHQCRLAVEPENLVRCTKLRKHSKLQPPRACNYVWCERDLEKRYGIDVDAIRAAKGSKEGHHDGQEYTFECPCCLEQCQNATCRKKKGLEPLGNVVKKAEASGLTMADFLRKSDAGEIDGSDTPKKKRKSTSKAKTAKSKSGDDSESELSDLESPPDTGKKSKATPKKKADTKAKPAAKSKAKAKSTKADPKAKAKNAKDAKSKAAKTKETKKKAEPKAKPAPKKKVMPEPPHPEIKNVETRMSFEEAEQRMFLREFVVRFRGILGLPDRSLAPLDDFDHPLPEATVRSVAGGLLDLIINDGGRSLGTSPDLIEIVEDLREELRHYADLARFAKIFSEVQEHFDIELAPEPSNESRERNERALREILDLEEGDATPTWATEAPRRGRAAASRIPSATEVVRMLIGLCNYVIHLDAVRQDMDPGWQNAEMDYRREAVRLAREENKRWEAEKKKIMAARVRCTTAAATRANKQLMDAREAEHRTALAGIELVPRTVAARKLTRFQELGRDAHERRYYFLTPRLIEEERYRPSGWARGLYIFGRGFPWDDGLPQAVERWMRVDSNDALLKLGHWVGYELYRKLDYMAKEGFWPAEDERKLGLTEEEREHALAAREARETAERERQKEREAADAAKRPPKAKVNGLSKAAFNEVAGSAEGPRSDAGSEQSELSSAPSQPEDLLALLDEERPPSYDEMFERYRLASHVMEVRQFVEQLELKGY